MIQHYLVGKNVHWYTLEEIKRGNKKDWVRVYRSGKVEKVDSSNTLALVRCEGKPIALEIADLTLIKYN